ncbi:hypothetical protein CIT292_08993 [Citrobacter youngae ATCC 29220]|uniref:Uncharacterized protein n=1 Tax=Citrobacter youngae ATCC 29220 TaxID=500640 RepID=D4BFH6_9ENTR|nr:hypothetical protein CIT292_08993 [Citrobacter youngae ATCC 29220]
MKVMGALLLITERLPKLRGRIPPSKRLTFCYAKRLSGAGTGPARLGRVS